MIASRIALAALLAASCAQSAAIASRPECATGWHAGWSAASAAALCLPPEFVRPRDRPATWRRESDGILLGLITIHIDSLAKWDRGEVTAHWPATLPPSGPCVYADCVTTDSLVGHIDNVGGRLVRVETGRLTGGAVGMRRQPALVAGWDVAAARRVYVSVLADEPATLDTLRTALHTLRLAVQ